MLLKKIFWFWWRKKTKSDSEFLSYNLMLNCGKKFCALRDKKNNILTLVLSEKKFLNETKKHNPPFKLNGRSLRCPLISNFEITMPVISNLLWHSCVRTFNLHTMDHLYYLMLHTTNRNGIFYCFVWFKLFFFIINNHCYRDKMNTV